MMRSFNDRLIKAQEEQNHINVTILQILTNTQKRDNIRSNPSNVGQERRSVESRFKIYTRKRTLSPRKGSVSRARNASLLRYSSSRSCDSCGSQSTPNNTSHRLDRRINFKIILQGEIRKERPPTFDGENRTFDGENSTIYYFWHFLGPKLLESF